MYPRENAEARVQGCSRRWAEDAGQSEGMIAAFFLINGFVFLVGMAVALAISNG